tara:strand:+ start:2144 stop:4948 length:2805 start_codon:yes stop_codon:yes gene_type:complete
MAENFLKYTNLNYDEINAQIRDKLNSDPRFDNPRESAIFQTLIEIFAGTTDIVNYYIQRRAEECYFDTAQLKSSIILLARQLGYVVTRPQPAKSKLKITLEGDFTGAFDTTLGADNKLQLPFYSKFSHDGDGFVLVDTFTYNVTSGTLSDMTTQGSDFKLELTQDSFNNDIVISEGDVREKVIIGNSNTQVGSNFQIYKIEDKEFSNVYGDKDFFFNDVTQVYVGNEKTPSTQYQIDRRSLINWESLESNDLSAASQVCLIRTTPDEFIEVIFGDDKFAAKGPLTREDNVYIQYLATNGSDGNKVGVIDNKVNYSGKIFTSTGVEITDKVKFNLYANITGGADIEENDSIKFSAPQIYYSLDRLVSKSDYVAYLKSLKTPLDVQNALAWGEQEERDRAGIFADIKMFNVALFTVVGSLYNLDTDIFTVKTVTNRLNEAVLDIDYDPYAIQVQSYFNVYTRQAIAYQLKRYDVLRYYKKLIGNSIRFSPIYYKDAYGSNGFFEFTYVTDTFENASNIIGEGNVTIDFTSLTNASTMQDVASKINDEIIAFSDVRANIFDNANYDSPAFVNSSDDIVVWNPNDGRFEFNFGSDTPTYIDSTAGGFASDIGITNSPETVAVLEQEEMSGEIVQVVDDLNTRAQLNVSNVYISPIIHNFNLEGTVYVKPLYDKEALRTELNNKVYTWLDLNADFNAPIDISNISSQFDVHTGVNYADVALVPEDITAGINNTENTFYGGWDEPLVVPYGLDLQQLLFSQLITYLEGTSTYEEIDEKRHFYIASWWEVLLEKRQYFIHNYINERSFFNNFLKKLFDELLYLAEVQKPAKNAGDQNDYQYLDDNGNNVVNYRRFIGYSSPTTSFKSFNRFFAVTQDSDFSKVATKIHKDLSYIIAANMLDSNGNIEEEYNSEDSYVRGGYSLGSEIVKVNLKNLKYEYKK